MKKYVWDNSNIVESYPGVCSPLTFSFARYIYHQVYFQTGIFFGVSPEIINKNTRKLDTFLGYFEGRFYYNLETWCDLISHMPGFGENPKMLQEMMGVRTEDRIEIPEHTTSTWSKVKLVSKLFYYHLTVDRLTKEWVKRFDQSFTQRLKLLDQISLREYVAYEALEFYFNLENDYLNHWQIPILNDFLVMIYSGLLKTYYRKFLKKEFSAQILNNIGSKGNVGIILELEEIAREIVAQPKLETLFCENDDVKVWQNLKRSLISLRLQNFLDTYGLRNGHDLKLENPSLREEPSVFISLLRQYIEKSKIGAKTNSIIDTNSKSLIERYLVKLTKKAMSRREEMRVKRSQIFGLVRSSFLLIGRELAKAKVIASPNDVFFLEMEEIFKYLQGTSTFTTLKFLIDHRHRQLNNSKGFKLKPHFITNSFPYLDKSHLNVEKHEMKTEMKGTANYPGVISGEVIVLEQPNFAQKIKGKILVCPQTDPSWTPIFGLISGLIVERGGILSHAAIVTRELKIPSIIGVSNITRKLKTGDKIRLDSKNGVVTKL